MGKRATRLLCLQYALVVVCLGSRLMDPHINALLILVVRVPVLEPLLQVLESWLENLPLPLLLHKLQDMHEHMHPKAVVVIEEVENRGQGIAGESEAVGRRCCDRLQEIRADGG
jgi:hypothetical protein